MNTMHDEIVSVIIPTYKGHSTLGRAINSVLTQTYQNFEIIVVDDNAPESQSRKNTQAVMDGFQDARIRYVKHEQNRNGSAARNTGIKCAHGKYVAFLDDDDIYFSNRILSSVEALESNPKCGMVFCDVLHAYGEWYGCIHRANPEWLTPQGVLLHADAVGSGSNLFLRKSLVENIGGFDEDFARHQDLEFAIRATEKAEAFIINEAHIFKGFNETCNVPDFKKLYTVKLQYTEKFINWIDRLNQQDRKRYYTECFDQLYRSALLSEDPKNAVTALQYAKVYGISRNIKQCVQAVMVRLGVHKLSFYRKYAARKERQLFTDLSLLCGDRLDEFYEKIVGYKLL